MQPPDNFTYLIFVDPLLHTSEKPFCYDARCACHEDDVAICQVSLHVQDGLMTPDEAADFVRGKGI
jgi:predicted HD phosphohydrolase